jgi:protein disulfide-isomerase A6
MSNIEVELYYANWCPHCVNFKSDWKKFKKAVDGKIVCRQYEESENKELMAKKGINGFPTLRIIVDGNMEEYDGQCDFKTLHNYVMNKMNKLGSESDNKSDNESDNKKLPVKITLYYAEWCGYCKRFKPTWEKLKEAFNGKVNYAEYESENKKVMERENIRSFPTIKITYNGQTEIYKGGREFDVLFSHVMEKAGYSSNTINNMINEHNEENQDGGDQEGGKRKKTNKNFYNKYLKYKAKYLKLKKQKQ